MTVKSKKNKTRKHKKYAKANAKAKAKSKKMIKNKNRKGVKRVQKYGGKPMTTADQIAQGKTINELTEIITNYESEYSNLSEQRFDNLFNGLPDDPEIHRRINEIEPVLERLRSILQERIIAENRNQTQN